MAFLTNQYISTLQQVLEALAPFAGGTVPLTTDEEYAQWVGWIKQKQEEYAVRAFWRRLLTREEIVIEGETTVLPDRFHKANGLYILDVGGENYADEENPRVSVEMIGDLDDEDFGKWQMRFKDEITTPTDAVLWYFAAPPVPVEPTDKLLLPGDMVMYAALGEYFRSIGADGSQDKAEMDAENRFLEYIGLEVIPPVYELLTTSKQNKVSRNEYLKQFYYRPNRY